jgi:hypothetical protein
MLGVETITRAFDVLWNDDGILKPELRGNIAAFVNA